MSYWGTPVRMRTSRTIRKRVATLVRATIRKKWRAHLREQLEVASREVFFVVAYHLQNARTQIRFVFLTATGD